MALERLISAATESLWGCRLSYARLKTPVDPPSIAEFDPIGEPDAPWVYDWYSHVLFAQRLLDAAVAILDRRPTDALRNAVGEFRLHWEYLRPLRNILQHPLAKDVDLDCLWAKYDRLTYQRRGCEPDWDFTIDGMHEPVEALYGAIPG